MDEKALVSGIKRKLEMTTAQTLDAASGWHFTEQHIGLTNRDLATRCHGKRPVSTYSNVENVNIVFENLSKNDKIIAGIVRWIYKKPNSRVIVKLRKEQKPLGTVYSNYQYTDGYVPVLVLESHDDEDYRNRYTGLPFDLVTIELEP